MLVINDQIQVPLKEFQFSYVRSQGPGGQNVNKVSSKAALRWNVVKNSSLPEPVRRRFLAKYHRRITNEGEFVLASQRFRDRGRNVADCLSKLRELILQVAEEPKARRVTRPTKGSQVRRRKQKEAMSQKKQGRRSSGWE